jgi:hypothetical protein
VLGCVDGKEFRKKRTEVEVFARASWGAAVLRPYMITPRLTLLRRYLLLLELRF